MLLRSCETLVTHNIREPVQDAAERRHPFLHLSLYQTWPFLRPQEFGHESPQTCQHIGQPGPQCPQSPRRRCQRRIALFPHRLQLAGWCLNQLPPQPRHAPEDLLGEPDDPFEVRLVYAINVFECRRNAVPSCLPGWPPVVTAVAALHDLHLAREGLVADRVRYVSSMVVVMGAVHHG
ncbi:hypothetical protein CSUB01_11609 [Colletotrichum sublineola]|uniref:Uncharacterized protein n=1 Tax=Colletotrichum sublineola TaxID=1173701 RepID=A0A066WZ29_COLSU|nr:hypothetical protein CSUB01_11609 [Colletotrichum sublineola]